MEHPVYISKEEMRLLIPKKKKADWLLIFLWGFAIGSLIRLLAH